jgi:hypothetical protein
MCRCSGAHRAAGNLRQNNRNSAPHSSALFSPHPQQNKRSAPQRSGTQNEGSKWHGHSCPCGFCLAIPGSTGRSVCATETRRKIARLPDAKRRDPHNSGERRPSRKSIRDAMPSIFAGHTMDSAYAHHKLLCPYNGTKGPQCVARIIHESRVTSHESLLTIHHSRLSCTAGAASSAPTKTPADLYFPVTGFL